MVGSNCDRQRTKLGKKVEREMSCLEVERRKLLVDAWC